MTRDRVGMLERRVAVMEDIIAKNAELMRLLRQRHMVEQQLIEPEREIEGAVSEDRAREIRSQWLIEFHMKWRPQWDGDRARHIETYESPLERTYRGDTKYLESTIDWRTDPRYAEMLVAIDKHFPDRTLTMMDLGCATGQTGTELLLMGYAHVVFCDWEGAGLSFLRHVLPLFPEFAGRWRIVPYGEEQARTVDVVVCADAIEHMRDTQGAIRWIDLLATKGAVITYPTNCEWKPPYERDEVHNWVDDEAILGALSYWFDDEPAVVRLGEYEAPPAVQHILEWRYAHNARLAVVRR